MYNHQLDAFIRAADEGSFTKAAEKMYITTPALIQQVTLLEKSMGAKLLERSRTGVRLTAAGIRTYENAKKIIELSDETKEYVKKLDGEDRIKIKIARTPTAKYRYLAKYIHLMETQEPNVEFEYLGFVPSGGWAGDYLDFSEGAFFDYSLRRAGFLTLLDSPLCVALPKAHPLYGLTLIDPEDLKDTPIFMIPKGRSSHFDRVRAILQKAGVHIIEAGDIYSQDVYNICRELNYGVITPAIWQDVHPDLLIHIMTETVTIPYGIAYYPPLSPAAERFIAMIRKDAYGES